MLDLAQIETGRIQLVMEAVDLGEVLRECAGLTRILAEKGRFTLENLVPVSAAPTVWADRARLKQILLNLLSNGLKYNHPGGRVTVSCKEFESGRLRISIRDTGQGIPEARIGDLFEPFARLGAERSDVEGTGIVLNIVEQLTMAMGGELGVESRPGEGSTFWVELELRPETAEARDGVETEVAGPERTGAGADQGRCRILYIEDGPISLAMMRETLNRRPGTVLLDAPNAELGLELAHGKQPEVILMASTCPGWMG